MCFVSSKVSLGGFGLLSVSPGGLCWVRPAAPHLRQWGLCTPQPPGQVKHPPPEEQNRALQSHSNARRK